MMIDSFTVDHEPQRSPVEAPAGGPCLLAYLRQLLVIAALPTLVYLISIKPDEPIFEGDSNRHVMTSVFFRDYLADGVLQNPKSYAEQYYEQYPALGLLIWPPLFHGICGVMMLGLGTSVSVARLLVLISLIVSTMCVFRIAGRMAGQQIATVSAIVFATMPIIFQYSRDVMLEMPTMAFVLLSVDQFDLWLSRSKTKSLYCAAIAAALAALTRFDAAVLLPFYGLMMLSGNQWRRLFSRHVLFAAAIAIVLVAPVYLVIIQQTGELHFRQAAESVGGSVDGTPNGFLSTKNLWFYPLALAEQAGLVTGLLAVTGLLMTLCSSDRRRKAVWLSLILATYITFTPLAELRARHAMYWLPAFAYFSAVAVEAISRRIQLVVHCRQLPVTAAGYALLLCTTAMATVHEPAFRVTGYQQAAEYVLSQTHAGDRVFFDGWWDGNFTFYMRHLDDQRSRSVIRGDRLLYDFVCVPSTDFRTHAGSQREMLEMLIAAEPKLVVLEFPQFYERIEVAEQLRSLVHAHPQLFIPVQEIPVQSTVTFFPRFSLQIFRFDSRAAQSLLDDSDSLNTLTTTDWNQL